MKSYNGTRSLYRLRMIVTALALFLAGFVIAPGASAQDEEPKKPVVTFGNEDAKEAPPINVVREKPKPKAEVEDAEGEEVVAEGEEAEEGEEGEPKEGEEGKEGEKKEQKVVNSFVKLDGNGRYHLASCDLVKRSKRAKQTLNGAKVLEMRLYACSVCKPPKPQATPPKEEGEAKDAEGDKATKPDEGGDEEMKDTEGGEEAESEEEPERRGRSMAPRGRPEPEEPAEAEEGADPEEEAPSEDEDEDEDER